MMHPKSAVRIGTGQLTSHLPSVQEHWAAANQAPTIGNLMAIAADATGLIIDVQNLTRDNTRLLHAVRAAVLARRAGAPDPVAGLVALLAELGEPVHDLTSVSP